MTNFSQTLAIAAIVVGLLALWQVAASASAPGASLGTVSLSSSPAAVFATGDYGRDTGAYTSGNDRVTATYTPVSQVGGWIDRARHGEMTHRDKNRAWIGGGLLILLL
jgi:hypothetical protein